MALLIFHLVLSSFTFEGVDVSLASKIVKWNLKRYPNGASSFPMTPVVALKFFRLVSYTNHLYIGVFFLFGAGRLGLMHSQPTEAIRYYKQAMESQTQYRNLHHISFWEIAIAHLALWDVEASLACWRNLEREATVCVPFGPLSEYFVKL